ncbi:MAG: hypothetical protein RIS70_3591 [Planctomycetota bacterium]
MFHRSSPACFRTITFFATCGIASLLVCVAESRGQTLLERLEKRLQDATDITPQANREDRADANTSLGIVVSDQAEADGMRVIEVQKGSQAERAGFQVDDIVTAINDRRVGSVEEIAEAMRPAARKAGPLKFDLLRDGDPKQIFVTPPPAPRTSPPPQQVPVIERPALGITVAPVTDDLRAKYGFPVRRGAVISAIRPGGSATRYGLPIGGVIIAVDGRKIETPQDLIDLVRRQQVGQEVELTYYDGPELQHKKIRLNPELEPYAPSPDKPKNAPPPPPAPRLQANPPDLLPAPRTGAGAAATPDRPLIVDRAATDRIARPGILEELQQLRAQAGDLKEQVASLKEQVAELKKRLDAVSPAPAEKETEAPKPAEPKPAEQPKPEEAKPEEAKPEAAKPETPKAEETKPDADKPGEKKSSDQKPETKSETGEASTDGKPVTG